MIDLTTDIDISFEGFQILHRDLWEKIGKNTDEDIFPKKVKEKLVRETYKEYDPNLYEALSDNSDCFACVYANQQLLITEHPDHFCTLCPITKWRNSFDTFGMHPCKKMEYGEFLKSECLDERQRAAAIIKNLEWSKP